MRCLDCFQQYGSLGFKPGVLLTVCSHRLYVANAVTEQRTSIPAVPHLPPGHGRLGLTGLSLRQIYCGGYQALICEQMERSPIIGQSESPILARILSYDREEDSAGPI